MWKALLLASLFSVPAHASLVTFEWSGGMGLTGGCGGTFCDPPGGAPDGPFTAAFSLDSETSVYRDIAWGPDVAIYRFSNPLILNFGGHTFQFNDGQVELHPGSVFNEGGAIQWLALNATGFRMAVGSSSAVLPELTLAALIAAPLDSFHQTFGEIIVRPPGTTWELGGHVSAVRISEPTTIALLAFALLVPVALIKSHKKNLRR
jgi:hypothetical protein